MARHHRNNAAEWVMVIVLTPIAWISCGCKKMFTRRVHAKPVEPVKRAVMIEGLPPRTMN